MGPAAWFCWTRDMPTRNRRSQHAQPYTYTIADVLERHLTHYGERECLVLDPHNIRLIAEQAAKMSVGWPLLSKVDLAEKIAGGELTPR